MWTHCGNVCWSWPLSLVWVFGLGRGELQANCALPKGLQQTVETLAPSHRPLHCVNICAFGFSEEETEAQISVPEGWSLEETGPWEQPFQKGIHPITPLCPSAPSQAAPSPNRAPPSDLGHSGALPAPLQVPVVSSTVDGSSLHASQPLCRLWSSTQVCLCLGDTGLE